MNEEEIIKRLKNIIETNKSFLDCDIQENSNIYKDIQGLLDLYQQEKEKNKLLIDGKFREVADKNSYIKDNYISKDKIKAKIEELEKLDFGTDLVSQFTANLTTITILQSLLEKE